MVEEQSRPWRLDEDELVESRSFFTPDEEDMGNWERRAAYWVPLVWEGRKTTERERKMFLNQEQVIYALGHSPTLKAASDAVGLRYSSVRKWGLYDYFDWNERRKLGQDVYIQSLEQLMDERIKAQKPSDNPALLIFRLKRLVPEYRDNYRGVAIQDDIAQAWADMKKAVRDDQKRADEEERVTVKEVLGESQDSDEGAVIE